MLEQEEREQIDSLLGKRPGSNEEIFTLLYPRLNRLTAVVPCSEKEDLIQEAGLRVWEQLSSGAEINHSKHLWGIAERRAKDFAYELAQERRCEPLEDEHTYEMPLMVLELREAVEGLDEKDQRTVLEYLGEIQEGGNYAQRMADSNDEEVRQSKYRIKRMKSNLKKSLCLSS